MNLLVDVRPYNAPYNKVGTKWTEFIDRAKLIEYHGDKIFATISCSTVKSN